MHCDPTTSRLISSTVCVRFEDLPLDRPSPLFLRLKVSLVRFSWVWKSEDIFHQRATKDGSFNKKGLHMSFVTAGSPQHLLNVNEYSRRQTMELVTKMIIATRSKVDLEFEFRF